MDLKKEKRPADFFQGHKPIHVFKTRIVGADWLGANVNTKIYFWEKQKKRNIFDYKIILLYFVFSERKCNHLMNLALYRQRWGVNAPRIWYKYSSCPWFLSWWPHPNMFLWYRIQWIKVHHLFVFHEFQYVTQITIRKSDAIITCSLLQTSLKY